VPAKRLSTAALVLYASALALGLGISSAYFALAGEYPFGGVQAGPWKAWPEVGSRTADPYARAIVTRRAEIPLAIGEGLALTATADSSGQTLQTGCAYRLGSVTPAARLWTLTVYDSNGVPVQSELGRSGFTSAEILRAPDGRFTIQLGRDARAGNWLQLPPSGTFSLMLRLYDTPVATGSAALDPGTLPSIERLECGA
jgi:hypothetical protein